MKKIIGFAVVLAVIMTSTAFAAPRRDAGEMRFAWWGNPLRATQTNEVLAMFTQETGIHVETMEGTFGEYWPMMRTLAAAGNLPDVMQHDVSELLAFQEAGLLLDLWPFIADGRIDARNVSPALLDQGRIGGGIYAIPIGMNYASMVYNRTLLSQLGLTAPKNMNMAQFIELSRQIYQRSGVRTNWVSNAPDNPMHAILRGQGVNMFERTAAGWRLGGTPANYQVFFDILHQGIQEGWHFRPEHWGGRDRFALANDPLVYPPNIQADANLRSWIAIAWNGQLPAFQNAIGAGTQFALTTLPSADPARSNFGRASMFWSITSQASNPDAAAQLINFFVNNQAANNVMLFDRGVQANSAVLNAMTPHLDAPNRLVAEYHSWSIANSAPFNPLAPPGLGEIRNYLTLVSDLVGSGQLTPAAAATRFFNQANAILAR